MVRFGKNGTDATSACIRLSRRHRARAGRGLRLPRLAGLVHRLHHPPPGCLSARAHPSLRLQRSGPLKAQLEAHPGEFAADPGTHERRPARPDFLPGLRQLCDEHGAPLIFDETITGFRFPSAAPRPCSG